MMTNNESGMQGRDLLKEMTPRDFLKIGIDEIAYVRPMSVRGAAQKVYAIHAADGTQLSVMETLDLARATLAHNDLMQVTLH